MTKKLYIPLPNDKARKLMIEKSLSEFKISISDENMKIIIESSDGFSGF
jgi:SpoVK/Ycf46/Vps4 family AAA+-type ATPase